MNMKDPIGKTVELWGSPRTIIGVVKDFHYESLHKAITPVFFRLSPENNSQLMANIQPGKEKAVIDRLGALYARFNPGFAFEYGFLDERFKTLYQAEQRVAVLSRYFAGLAILISCLGLFGLAAYTAQSRQKEIAIRKVIGATIRNIVLMLSGDFLKTDTGVIGDCLSAVLVGCQQMDGWICLPCTHRLWHFPDCRSIYPGHHLCHHQLPVAESSIGKPRRQPEE